MRAAPLEREPPTLKETTTVFFVKRFAMTRCGAMRANAGMSKVR
jgi:hypothetical protein